MLNNRRASNLILNLFSLMVDTTIPDIAIEPDKTVKKVGAVLLQFFSNVMSRCASEVLPRL